MRSCSALTCVLALVAGVCGCANSVPHVAAQQETVTVAAPVAAEPKPTRTEIDPAFEPADAGDSGDPSPIPPAPIADAEDPQGPSTVRIGAVTVTSPRTADIVQKQLLTRVAPLKRCYEHISERGGRTLSSLRLRLFVNAQGRVQNAQIVQQSAPLDPALVKCTMDVMRGTVFSIAVGGVAEINFPVHFGP